MALFQFPRDDVIDAHLLALASSGRGPRPEYEPGPGPGPGAGAGRIAGLPRMAAASDLSDQFVLFQLGDRPDGPAVLESSNVDPKVAGSDDSPDVLVGLEMLSFHLGREEGLDKDARATLRVTVGKDENSTDTRFEPVFWSVAAGLQLYDSARGRPSASKDLRGDFARAFNRRPIEIPGGLGKLSFEVVKHREPSWWQRLFGFAQGEAGKALVSALGFPAISYQAIGLLDELLNRLEKSSPEVLFRSLPLRLALSRWARDRFSPGGRVRVGCLSPGFCLLARAGDFKTILDANPSYYPTYGLLVPSGVDEAALLSGAFDDPFRDLTYAVFRVGMKATRLDPTFDFGV